MGAVSGAELTGIASDGAFIDSAPALTGSGAQIAYVHQAPGAPDGVATISIVDVTVPINETESRAAGGRHAARSARAAFKYRGARDPVISQNGRHLAFVSDTTASEALPAGARVRYSASSRPRRSTCGTGKRRTSAAPCG